MTLQSFDNPLHHTQLNGNQNDISGILESTHIVHHLNERNEENDGRKLKVYKYTSPPRSTLSFTYSADEEPMLGNGLCIEEECCSSRRLVQEIRGKGCYPVED